MTRNELELIARALRKQRPGENWDANKRVQWDLDCKGIADTLADCHARFNRAIFFAACGGLFNV